MEAESLVGTVIAIVTALMTYQGLKHRAYQNQYAFHVDSILIDKEYTRLISSGFLHVSWIHFAFNMIALMAFAWSIETQLGITNFLFIYFLSMLGGGLLSLYIHRQHGDYTAVGASGAVSGIVASSIILFPYSEIGLIILPGGITSWIFGLLFILISMIGIVSQNDNIGHEAHLGGIITGIVVTIFMSPTALLTHWWIVLLMLVPTLIFLFVITKRKDILLTGKWNIEKPQIKRKEVSVDAILDKIKEKGIDSLTSHEKQILDNHSNKNR